MSRSPIPRTVWALGLVSLLMDISSEMVAALLPLYLTIGLGASALAVGVIEGVSIAIATMVKFLSGLMADRLGRNKPLALLGYGLGALSRFIFPVAVAADQIMFAKAVDRVGKGIRSAPRDALIAGVTAPEIRGAAFGLRKSLDTVGGFAGPLIAVALMLVLATGSTADDIRAVFWIATIPAALAVLFLAFGVDEPRVIARKSSRFDWHQALRLTPAVWGAIAVASLIMLARFSEAFILLRALDAGFATAFVPLAMVAMHLAYGATAWPVGRLSDRIGRRGLLLASLGFLIAAHLGLAMADSVTGFIVATLFWGLHMGFSQGLLGAMIADTIPDALKGSAFGVFHLVTGAVAFVANLGAGALWHGWGGAAPFWAGAAVSAFAAALLMVKPRLKPTLRTES